MLSSLLKITADLFEIVGKFGGAERCWRKISFLNSNAENLTATGYICFKNKNFQDAENYFRKAIKKSPKYCDFAFSFLIRLLGDPSAIILQFDNIKALSTIDNNSLA